MSQGGVSSTYKFFPQGRSYWGRAALGLLAVGSVTLAVSPVDALAFHAPLDQGYDALVEELQPPLASAHRDAEKDPDINGIKQLDISHEETKKLDIENSKDYYARVRTGLVKMAEEKDKRVEKEGDNIILNEFVLQRRETNAVERELLIRFVSEKGYNLTYINPIRYTVIWAGSKVNSLNRKGSLGFTDVLHFEIDYFGKRQVYIVTNGIISNDDFSISRHAIGAMQYPKFWPRMDVTRYKICADSSGITDKLEDFPENKVPFSAKKVLANVESLYELGKEGINDSNYKEAKSLLLELVFWSDGGKEL